MKKFMKILPVVLVVCMVVTSVFAVSAGNWDDITNAGSTSNNSVTNVVKDVWGMVATIVRILAVAAVVFAGLRYMFASADQKADIKKSMGILAIGAILVFGATFILDIISDVTGDVLDNNNTSAIVTIQR